MSLMRSLVGFTTTRGRVACRRARRANWLRLPTKPREPSKRTTSLRGRGPCRPDPVEDRIGSPRKPLAVPSFVSEVQNFRLMTDTVRSSP
ncbi:hypothetical protein SORBI_3006G218850 [Sorghum bicolor]|uniref:Uncharacterized protein n=1 Tax=Sorghum bicolor TaxID=4558 RepID=A0A1Z5RF28_SORBI|nr:hypothetical protein SORBI_3006G218850 [Sorghum bicolor]